MNIFYRCLLENIIENSSNPKAVEVAKEWLRYNDSTIHGFSSDDYLQFFDSNWENDILKADQMFA